MDAGWRFGGGRLTIATMALAAGLLSPGSTQAQAQGNAPDGESQAIASIRQLSERELKAFYVRCARAAIRQTPGATEVALCSVGYELLLTRSFRGDFHALLAWSRSQADQVE